jgi:hypothetical protein
MVMAGAGNGAALWLVGGGMDRCLRGGAVGILPEKPELRTGDSPPGSARGTHGEKYGSAGAIVARFRRLRAGDRGLIAARPALASLCLPAVTV